MNDYRYVEFEYEPQSNSWDCLVMGLLDESCGFCIRDDDTDKTWIFCPHVEAEISSNVMGDIYRFLIRQNMKINKETPRKKFRIKIVDKLPHNIMLCNGIYVPKDNTIYIKSELKPFKKLGVLFHEIGHCYGRRMGKDHWFHNWLDHPAKIKKYTNLIKWIIN